MKRGVVLIIVLALFACTSKKPPGIPPSYEAHEGSPETRQGPSREVRHALVQAEEAEESGDEMEALAQYDRAFLAEGNRDRQAVILYRIAGLRADPSTPVHDPEAASKELDLLIRKYPGFDRRREARLMLRLVEALGEARAEASAAAGNSASLRAETLSLREQLKKKEEELEKIKQVLLQGKP